MPHYNHTAAMDIHRCRFVDYAPHTVTLTGFSHSLSQLPASLSDLRLAVGRSNGDIEIWNPKQNWIHEITLSGGRGRSIEGLVWTNGANDVSPRLFSIGGSTYITEWDLATGRPRTNYDCNAGVIWSISANAAGDRLAVGCDDGLVAIIDISGGFGSLEHDTICQRQDQRVLSIKWVDNVQLVGGCADARIRVWSADGDTKGRLLSTLRVDKLKTESTLVWSIEVLPNKRQIVSGDSTGSVKFWDLTNFSLLQSFKLHEADVLCLAVDLAEENIFSAGVDRKIHQFSLVTGKSRVSKWVHGTNRLLHSNDVRTMSIFESKNYNFLVSGGVEKSVVIQSVKSFYDGKYRKVSINQLQSNIIVNPSHKLVVMWQDQTVKLWQIMDDSKHRLVSKVTLADEDNITSVALNETASLLVVATMGSVKVFLLAASGKKGKLTVTKFRDDNFNSLVAGAKKVLFYSTAKLLIVSAEEEIYRFTVDAETKTIAFDNEIETLGTSHGKSKLSYAGCINNVAVSNDSTRLILSRFNGAIEVLPLEEDDTEAYVLTKLSGAPHLLRVSNKNTLFVVTEENKLYEFFLEKGNKELLTPWSKRNSEFLPEKFLNLEEKPQGSFIDNNKIWIFGSNWLSFFDLSVNIPIHKKKEVAEPDRSKKRTRDGLSIIENEGLELNGAQESAEALEQALKQSQMDRLKEKIDEEEEDDDEDGLAVNGSKKRKPFWITTKYRPILRVDKFGDNEIAVVESKPFANSAPAFSAPKFRV